MRQVLSETINLKIDEFAEHSLSDLLQYPIQKNSDM